MKIFKTKSSVDLIAVLNELEDNTNLKPFFVKILQYFDPDSSNALDYSAMGYHTGHAAAQHLDGDQGILPDFIGLLSKCQELYSYTRNYHILDIPFLEPDSKRLIGFSKHFLLRCRNSIPPKKNIIRFLKV